MHRGFLPRFGLLLLAFATTNVWSAPETIPADINNYYDRELIEQNACKPTELAHIRKRVMELAKGRSASGAWELIRRMLCSTHPADKAYVRARTTDEVEFSDNTETADASVARRALRPEQMELVEMYAWDVVVQPDT